MEYWAEVVPETSAVRGGHIPSSSGRLADRPLSDHSVPGAYTWVQPVRLRTLDFGKLDSPQSAIAPITEASFLPLSVNV
jgi:hypothetical protein